MLPFCSLSRSALFNFGVLKEAQWTTNMLMRLKLMENRVIFYQMNSKTERKNISNLIRMYVLVQTVCISSNCLEPPQIILSLIPSECFRGNRIYISSVRHAHFHLLFYKCCYVRWKIVNVVGFPLWSIMQHISVRYKKPLRKNW